MQRPVLRSPAAFAQEALKPEMGVINQMMTANSFADPATEAEYASRLSLCDVSFLQRFGCKGPAAAEWLSAQGLPVPEQANHYVQQGVLRVLRLGNSEFLVEEEAGSEQLAQLNQTDVPERVHAVLRNDAAFVISGPLVSELFAQVCDIDVTAELEDESRLVMTMMAGVSVTMLRQKSAEAWQYRVWCDGTLGVYLWQTLLTIIQELGGGPVGANQYFKSI